MNTLMMAGTGQRGLSDTPSFQVARNTGAEGRCIPGLPAGVKVLTPIQQAGITHGRRMTLNGAQSRVPLAPVHR